MQREYISWMAFFVDICLIAAMQAFFVGGLTRAVRYAADGMITTVFKWFGAFLRRQLIGAWMRGLGVPEHMGMLRDSPGLFLKNSAYYSLQSFFSEKPCGATVFWAPEWAGKTYTLAQMGVKSTVDYRIVYVDFAAADDAKKVFYRQMGLDLDADTKPVSQYLPSGVFVTFIFDHFDKACSATMIASLAEDSMRSLSFNLLIMVKGRIAAHSLLVSCGEQRRRECVRLLGPPYCGRWSAAELGEMSDSRYDSLVDQCGTLAPMISILNRTCPPWDQHMLLRVAKLEAEWEQGEQMLGQFRVCEC